MELNKLLRKNILDLKPYSSARDEYTGEAMVFLDANENPFNQPYNRYPDPLQRALKEKIAVLKKVEAANIFLGNGSDEPIDLLIRAFLRARQRQYSHHQSNLRNVPGCCRYFCSGTPKSFPNR